MQKDILRQMFLLLSDSLKSENSEEQMMNTYQKQLALYQMLKTDKEKVCARCLLSLYRCFINCDNTSDKETAGREIIELSSFFCEGKREEIRLRADDLSLKEPSLISDSVLFLYKSAMQIG